MEPYGEIDTAAGWVAILYRWTPVFAMLAVLLGMAFFDGVDLKRKVRFYPMLKIKMGKMKQFMVRRTG